MNPAGVLLDTGPPISLTDACLIRCAEIHREPRVLTFDLNFGIYRWARNREFQPL